jgi:hypothetical protein
MDHEIEYSIIRDKIAEYYERLNIEVQVDVEYRNLNWFEATATYTDKRMGVVKAHYTVLLKDGHRVEFQ